RGATYTLATAVVIGLYATVVVLVGDLLGAGLEPVSEVARFAAIIVAALLFAPIKDQFQVWIDKFFYRDRYNVRQTLLDFGRPLGSEVNLEYMLDGIVDRLCRALLVDRAAIFLENPAEPETFVTACTAGITRPTVGDLDFLKHSAEE